MLDPAHDYGYTAEDKVFLEQNGVSTAEARAMERIACAQGVDC